MDTDLRAIARTLGGEISGGLVLAPGPHHSAADRSLAVRFDPRAPHGFVVTSFAGDDWRECRDYVRERLSGHGGKIEVRLPSHSRRLTDGERSARALAIFHEAGQPRGTPVERYLAGRGLELPDEAAGEAIRFHPNCPFKGRRAPAMVALVRNTLTNEPKAIHRTALTSDGRKGEVDGESRLSFGPVFGGAVKLSPDAYVTLCLGVGEGIETTLSLRLAPEFGASPVWSLLSAGQVAAFPVVAGVETLWIAVDHDSAGVKAARTLAERWRKARREVFLVKPRIERADLNDLALA